MKKNHLIYTAFILAAAAGVMSAAPRPVSAADTVLIGTGTGSESNGTSSSTQSSSNSMQDSTLSSTQDSTLNTTQSGTQSSTPGSASNDASSYEEEEKWSLILVNKTHPIPEDYKIPELTQLAHGNSIDSRVYPHLQEMFDAMRAQGINPTINSSYRTYEKQQELMDQKITEYENSGYQHEEAVRLAEEWVAIPGTSEHQLGLGLDISGDTSAGTEAGSVWYWLDLYAADYGFVKRYPEDKTDITGIINEPWHYRYVGVHAAKIMKEENLCLEEYLEKYK